MIPDRYVRRFDNRMERLVNPQEPARIWGSKPVTHTGFILPYGRGGYRHGFSEYVASPMMGDDVEQGMPFMAWVLLLGLGGALAYTLFQTSRT